MPKAQINIFQLYLLIMGASGLTNHVVIIPILLDVSGRDAWLAALAASIPMFIWLWMLHYVIRSTSGDDLLVWMNRNKGRWLSLSARALLLTYIYVNIVITIRDTVDWTLTSYLPQTPSFVLIFSLVLLCTYAAAMGLQTVAIAAGLVMPLVIALGYFVAMANVQHKDYSLLFPVLEHGVSPVLNGIIYVGSGSCELIVLLLLQDKLKKPMKLWVVLLLGLIMTMLTFGPTSGSIAQFGPLEAANQRFPAFEQWKIVKLGRFIEHTDFLSIYQWLAGAFVRMSLYIYFVLKYIPLGRSGRGKGWKVTLTAVSLIALANYFPLRDGAFLEALRYVYLPSTLVVIAVLTILLFGFAIYVRRKERTANG